jgi:hypothetical protein
MAVVVDLVNGCGGNLRNATSTVLLVSSLKRNCESVARELKTIIDVVWYRACIHVRVCMQHVLPTREQVRSRRGR